MTQGGFPEELNAMLDGFRASRVLLTAIELDIFSALSGGATAEAVARKLGADGRGVLILLNALAGLGLIRKSNGVFANGERADEFLREGAPRDCRLALKHRVRLWDRWTDLTGCVLRGGPDESRAAGGRGGGQTEAFIAAMEFGASLRAPAMAAALDLAGVRRVLDVGGGSGGYSVALARAKPDLQATVLDLPEVTALTRSYVKAAGLEGRIVTVDGDIFKDRFGEGFDLVLISSIVHIYNAVENVAMFKKARAALRPGGRVVVQEFILDDDKTGPLFAALFAVNMLVATSTGNSYSEEELRGLLSDAGFSGVTRVRLQGPSGLMVATA